MSDATIRQLAPSPGWRNSMVAMVTPFRGGEVDVETFARLCERQIVHGTTALAVCGSTGEGPALTPAEHGRIVAAAAEASGGRVPVIAGCGAPATEAACLLAQAAVRNGADALLCSAPPYSHPTQDGLFAHVRAVAQVTSRPVMVYDVPSRVGVAFADETVAQLFEAGLVAAIKDAGGSLSRPGRLRALCGDHLAQLSGDDATAAAHRAMGGHGCVSVSANVAPALCAQLHAAWDRADLVEFARARDLLAPLHQAMSRLSNPIPVKAALCMLGLCDGGLRLPLTIADSATLDAVATVVAEVTRAEDEAQDAATSPPRLRMVR